MANNVIKYVFISLMGLLVGLIVTPPIIKEIDGVRNTKNEDVNFEKTLVLQGNKGSYWFLRRTLDPMDFFFYSTIMSLNFDYGPACYDSYKCIVEAFKSNKNLGDMDSTSWHTAVFFLEQGKALGNDNCIVELGRLKKNGLLK